MKNFALAGNPNCGKTTLFNSLTGSTAHVGNWPGVTVDKRVGVCSLGKEAVNIVDLPGIYSLSPYTPEEVISRNYIIDEKPDCVIDIIDSTNLERNLYLTTQIMEMNVPVIVALNMMDVVEKNGDVIDELRLSQALGVPVVKISALKQDNLKRLMDLAIEAAEKKRNGKTVLEESPVGHLIKDLTIAFSSLGVSDPLFHACKLAELDELECANHPQLVNMVKEFQKVNVDSKFGQDYEALIADERYKYITSKYAIFMKKARKDDRVPTKSDKIDKVLTHVVFGIPIFLCILFVIFHFTFSENLFFLGGLFNSDCFDFIPDDSIWAGFKGLFYTENGINSPGVMLSNLVNGFTNIFSTLAGNALSGAPEWVSGLIVDGVLGGIFAVIGFLPQILVLFLFFSILEDSGYMARVAFILDKLFRKFGLSGRAFLPMIMGFGCSVPAMINTRTIADEKERIATIRVIPFFSCGAKLPILTAIAGCIAMAFGFNNVDLITMGMYVLGMVVAIVSVLLMRKTFMRGHSSPFIMELPTYHLPQAKSTALLVWDKAKHFVKKAFTVILASTIVIWFVSHFSWNWTYLPDEQMSESILSSIGQLFKPLFVPLGFGISEYGWVFVVAIVTGLIAKENVVATLGTLAASTLALMASKGIDVSATGDALNDLVMTMRATSSSLNPAALLAFIAYNMLTVPCFAAVATARGELTKKDFWITVIFWLAVSYVVSSAIYVIGSFWWTAFIYVAAIALIILCVHLYDKAKKNKEIKEANA